MCVERRRLWSSGEESALLREWGRRCHGSTVMMGVPL